MTSKEQGISKTPLQGFILQEFIMQEFIQANAILKGHFILSSGLHSDTYMQCAKVLMDPGRSERLCALLAKKTIEKLGENFADIIVSPAMGGVIVGYEVARQLGLPAIFCERVNGKFELRRGFELAQNTRVLVIEDVITTGESSLETFELVKISGAKIVAEATLVDRSGDKNLEDKLGVPIISLLQIEIRTFDNNDIPDDLKNTAAVKPGSRSLGLS